MAANKKPAAKKAAKKPAKKLGKKLTLKQQAFTEHYLKNGGNATAAAQSAGYAGSRHTLEQVGHENLRKPEIQMAVQERILDVVKADTDEVLRLFAAHLRGDVADFDGLFLPDGRLDLRRAKELGVSRLIKKLDFEPVSFIVGEDLKQVVYYRCKIEMHDSQSAASKLADIFGMKQQPRENEKDTEKKREYASKKLREVMERLALSEGDAMRWMTEHTPEAARYLM